MAEFLLGDGNKGHKFREAQLFLVSKKRGFVVFFPRNPQNNGSLQKKAPNVKRVGQMIPGLKDPWLTALDKSASPVARAVACGFRGGGDLSGAEVVSGPMKTWNPQINGVPHKEMPLYKWWVGTRLFGFLPYSFLEGYI